MLILKINLWFSQIDDEILVQMTSTCIFFHLTFNIKYT